jgi:pSer/pThr/pTyr-binding forkhead associated (FHA) protein
MKYPRVTLDVALAGHEEMHFVFDCPQSCIVGRAEDCDIRVSEDGHRREVSRHHCLLEIDPPGIRVYDLYSTNGTFVNGRRLLPNPECTDLDHAAGTELKDGDEVRIGNTNLHFWVEAGADVLEPASALLF